MLKPVAVVLAPLILLAVQGCTTEQRHAAGRAWSHNECSKEVGRTDRDQCNQLVGPSRP